MMWCEGGGGREKEKIGGGKDSDTYNIYISGTVCCVCDTRMR